MVTSSLAYVLEVSSFSCLFEYGYLRNICTWTAGQVFSGSWDKTLRCWDARSSSLAGTYAQPGEVTSMSLVGHRLVVATQGRHILVYDIRKMAEAEQSTETHPRFQTRSVCCFPDGTGTHPRQYL